MSVGALVRQERYGCDLFLLFEAMRQEAMKLNPMIAQIFLAKAEQFGEAWQKFVSENEDLLGEISAVLASLEQYHLLEERYRELRREQHFTEADKLVKDFDLNKLGLTGWNVLNSLLEQADKRMS